MAETVYLIGSARTDFARNLKKEGKSLRDMIVEAGLRGDRRCGN